MHRTTPLALFAFAALLTALVLADEKPESAPEWTTRPLLEGIVVNVPELAHPYPEGWQPTLHWTQVPLSFDDPMALKGELVALQARGILPCIEVSGDYADYWAYPATEESLTRALAQAKAVAAAGFPVHLAMKGVLALYIVPGGKKGQPVVHDQAPVEGQKTAVGGDFCCLPLRDGWTARAAQQRALFQRFAAAEIPIAGVWYDYEGLPYPWNGYYEHSQRCPGCRAAIPPEILADRQRFVAWALNLRDEAMVEAFAIPVSEVLPDALLGFYGFTLSSEAHPSLLTMGTRLPPAVHNPQEIDVVQPVCYASESVVGRFYNADWPTPRRETDAVYMATLLRTMSGLHWNMRDNQRMVPYVSSYVGTRQHTLPRMSKSLYREFLRHAMLRGARGFYCFTVSPPYGTMADYYEELADINHVYNELFAAPFRDFLEGGAVLHDVWPDPKDDTAVIWSGLAKGDRALVRILTLAASSRAVDIVPFPGGNAVHLIAQPAGSTYIVTRDGAVELLP